MTSIGSEYCLSKKLLSSVSLDISYADLGKQLISEFKGLNDPLLNEVPEILKKYIDERLYLEDHRLKVFYREIGVFLEYLNGVYKQGSEVQQLEWLSFYRNLADVLAFKAQSERWQRAAFRNLEELLDIDISSTKSEDVLGTLVYLKCVSNDSLTKFDSVNDAEQSFYYEGANVFLSFLETTVYKEFSFSAMLQFLKFNKMKLSSDEIVLSLCREAMVPGIDVESLIRAIECFSFSKHVIPHLIHFLVLKIERSTSITLNTKKFVIDLISSIEDIEVWHRIHPDANKLFSIKSIEGIDISTTVDLSDFSKQIRLLKYWMFLAKKEELDIPTIRFFFNYYFRMFEYNISEITCFEAKESLSLFSEISSTFPCTDEIKKNLCAFSVYIILKLRSLKGFSIGQLIPYVKQILFTNETHPSLLLDTFKALSSGSMSIRANTVFADIFHDLVEIFDYSIFEDRRDLAFYLLSSMVGGDAFDQVRWLCPTPVLYHPSSIELHQLQLFEYCFKNNHLSMREKVALFNLISVYYRLTESQLKLVINWVSVSINVKAGVSLFEYQEFLDLLLKCLDFRSQLLFCEESHSNLVGALKPPMRVCDFRALYRSGDDDPFQRYLNPVVSKINILIDAFHLNGEGILERYYFYWNAAVTEYLTKDLHVIYQTSRNKTLSKRKGKKHYIYPALGDQFLRSDQRLPFQRLQNDLMVVANVCASKLEGQPLYQRCSIFRLGEHNQSSE